jgi:hypothetical protein
MSKNVPGCLSVAVGIQRLQKLLAKTDYKGDPGVSPDWETKCEVCEAVPTLPATGMCGPCTFGAAETAGGNW